MYAVASVQYHTCHDYGYSPMLSNKFRRSKMSNYYCSLRVLALQHVLGPISKSSFIKFKI